MVSIPEAEEVVIVICQPYWPRFEHQYREDWETNPSVMGAMYYDADTK